MRRALMALALLATGGGAIAGPSPALAPALVGRYALADVGDTQSELELTPDGEFQWFLTHGREDRFAQGHWSAKDMTVILHSSLDGRATPDFMTRTLRVRGRDLVTDEGVYRRMPAP